MKNISWDAYQIFLAVSREGGLTGASQSTGLSPATLGRRILQLEEAAGMPLFTRSQAGYALTVEGQALFEQLLAMEAVSRKVESWREGASGTVTVRIMAGTWGARLLSENYPAIVHTGEAIHVDLRMGERRAPMAHRENDIAIRAVEPDEPSLIARQIGEVAYCAYRLRNAPSYIDDCWIAVQEEEAVSPYLSWTHREKSTLIRLSVDRPRSLLDLVRAGAGTAVLPCIVGDLDPLLERSGEEISGLRHRQWLVRHQDDSHRREIRLVFDRIVRLYRQFADVFAGKRPGRDG